MSSFPPCHPSSSHNDQNKDDDIIDRDNDDIDDFGKIIGNKDIDHNEYDKYRGYESYDSEEEWALNSLMENYKIVRNNN